MQNPPVYVIFLCMPLIPLLFPHPPPKKKKYLYIKYWFSIHCSIKINVANQLLEHLEIIACVKYSKYIVTYFLFKARNL